MPQLDVATPRLLGHDALSLRIPAEADPLCHVAQFDRLPAADEIEVCRLSIVRDEPRVVPEEREISAEGVDGLLLRGTPREMESIPSPHGPARGRRRPEVHPFIAELSSTKQGVGDQSDRDAPPSIARLDLDSGELDSPAVRTVLPRCAPHVNVVVFDVDVDLQICVTDIATSVHEVEPRQNIDGEMLSDCIAFRVDRPVTV